MTSTKPADFTTDAVVIGAGPVGLFQVFELGLLNIHAHVIDSLNTAGGQCIELYPDKPIYDIPAIQKITGRQLVANLIEQIKPFTPQFHFNCQVQSISQQTDGRFLLTTSKQQSFLTKTIFIATGVGVFQPQPLRVAGIEKFLASQLFYHIDDAQTFNQQNIVIVGGGDSAIDWTLEFCNNPKLLTNSLTLIHRRDVFTAAPHRVEQMRQLVAENKLRLIIGQISSYSEQDERLTSINVLTATNQTINLALDSLLVFFGMSPKLGPIAEWGVELQRKQILVDTEKFATSVAGIYAVGDINYYPGKKKLILCGFHETALAAYAASAHIRPENPAVLQYTTTNSKVQQLLGVKE